MRLVVLAVPCSAVLFVGSACLRGSGDTRTPFLIMVVVNAINIAACILLVHPRSPIGGHGIEGLAYGTVLAWMVGALSLLGVLIHGRAHLRLRTRYLTPRFPVLARIVRVGLPNLAEGAGMWIGNYLVIMLVGRLADKAAIGAHFVTIRIEALSFLPGFALAVSAATLVGQFLGVKDVRSARRAAWWCWGYGATLMTLTGLLFVAFPEAFVRLVTDKPEFLNTSPLLLRIVGLVQIGFASAVIFASVHRGAGDTRRAMLITYGSVFLLRLPLVYYLAVVQNLGLTGVWIGLSIELLLRGILFLGSFLQGDWAKAKV
jgi:putative MATE family efflux protein